MSSINHDDFSHLKIPLKDILSATNNFADENSIGGDDFGNHYVGELLRSGELIKIQARKWLNKEKDDEREQQFWMEVSMLYTLEHKNLVSLVGFCDENHELITVIKLETRGSLNNYLSYPMMLTWVRRLEVCVGLAQALSYIYYDESRDFSIIHGNIDSEIVLLNDNLEPKLSEFRLCMKIAASERHHSFHVDKVWDREGYTDPTYIETKSVSQKSDIYSFGVVMFELLCGREAVLKDEQDNNYLVPMVILHYREERLEDIVEWNLWTQMDPQSFKVFTKIAYNCLNEERSERPNINEIITKLEKALELARVNEHILSSPSNQFAHLKLPLQNILSATNNFAAQNHIWYTTFAKEYKGQLLWSGELIDITAHRFNKERNDREQLFWTEISMLSTLKHKNLVSLVGFCDENDEMIIIIRRETRGMLKEYLSDPILLTWVRRLEICVGVAHALSYIHYDEPRDFSVIKRFISIGIVVLNDEWEPKLYNFGVSMKIKASQRHHSFHTNRVTYVDGYGDPTYIETKKVSHKSDMYSFGIVLFELLCGRKPIIDNNDDNHLAPLAITHYREKRLEDIIDLDLWKQMDSESFDIFAETAYDCLNEERSQRPNIDETVPKLEKALKLACENRHIMSSPSNQFAHLKVPLQNILSATNNFAAQNHIWYTTIIKEYKGQLLWSGELIDISAKRFNKESNDREQLFWTEISTLSSLKHKNLVSLVGFCDDNDEKIVITRYETKGMLSGYLSDPMLLTWVRRLEISVGVAHALSYIHYDESRDFSVIHGRLCSANVVLNDDWEPKLSDFKYSMKIKASQRHHLFHTDTLMYVDGYGDPTYIETERVNHKSEMYSFGILMFELVFGRKSISENPDNKYLGPVAIFHYKKKILDEIIDPVLWKQMDPQSFNVFAEIAYDCLNEERSQRPNINEIVTRLESALEHQRERQNYDKSIGEGSSSFIHKKFQHLKIELQAIKAATKEFDDSHCIGKGGFGKVYKGELVQGQSVVALKRLNRAYGQGDPEFWKEIIMLSLYKHANIVSLLGFCDDCGEKILVYDYASRKSLDLYLDDKDLTWVQRLKICIGAARGIAYLHNPGKTQQRVLHRDIKSSNILLDENWNARIADFGLSKFGPANQQYTFLVSNGVGTIGYCDPLYVETGLLTKESDVYSFGVVLFEILCGRLCIRNNHDKHQPLTTLVRKCYEQKTIADIVYGNIRDEISSHSLKEFTAIAYQCLNRDQEQRPLMTKVVEVLQSALICQVFNEPSLASLSLE